MYFPRDILSWICYDAACRLKIVNVCRQKYGMGWDVLIVQIDVNSYFLFLMLISVTCVGRSRVRPGQSQSRSPPLRSLTACPARWSTRLIWQIRSETTRSRGAAAVIRSKLSNKRKRRREIVSFQGNFSFVLYVHVCSIFILYLLYQNGQDFLDIQ